MTRSKLKLFTEVKNMLDWLDVNLESVSDKQAEAVLQNVLRSWEVLERRIQK